jgi:hypothetical protein
MIVNFKTRKISRDTHKLAEINTLMLIKTNKNKKFYWIERGGH